MYDKGEQSMKRRVNHRLARVAVVLLASGTWVFAAGIPIRNDTVWKDDRGQEIMCQGGSLCQFGETFYFYGWGDYPGDNRKDTITCYSSRDLASWKFERHIYTRDMTNLTLIVPDRLHVIYNAATKKYVMIGKHILPVNDPPIPGQPRVTGGVSFFTSETPTGAFAYLGHEMLPAGTGTDYHRDLADLDGIGLAAEADFADTHDAERGVVDVEHGPAVIRAEVAGVVDEGAEDLRAAAVADADADTGSLALHAKNPQDAARVADQADVVRALGVELARPEVLAP